MKLMLVDDGGIDLSSLNEGIGLSAYSFNDHALLDVDWVSKVIHTQPDMLILAANKTDTALFVAIKALKEQLSLPVVLFSDIISKDLIKQAYCAGFEQVIDSSFSAPAINTMLHAALARFEINQPGQAKSSDEGCPAIVAEAKHVLMYLRRINEQEAMSTLQTMSSRSKRDITEVAKSIVTLANYHA